MKMTTACAHAYIICAVLEALVFRFSYLELCIVSCSLLHSHCNIFAHMYICITPHRNILILLDCLAHAR